MGLSATSQGTIRIRNGAVSRYVGGVRSGRGNPWHGKRVCGGNRLGREPVPAGRRSFIRRHRRLWERNGGGDRIGRRPDYFRERLPRATGGAATLTITDLNSKLVQTGAAGLTIGHATDGSAVLNIRNHAQLISGTGPVNVNATGQVNLESGAVFDARGPININGGQFNFLGGSLHVDNFNGNLLNQGGTLAPGHSAGATAVSGNYTQRAAAALEIEIGGVLPGQRDTLTVAGNAILDGTIEVELLEGFQPVIGNSFTIVTTTFGNVGGQFDTELFPTIAGVTFDVIYNLQSVVLQVIEATTLPGDYNANGTVDAADYVVWRKGLGTIYVQTDYNVWHTHFGQSAGSGAAFNSVAASSAVPEPTALALVVLAYLAGPLVSPRNKLHDYAS